MSWNDFLNITNGISLFALFYDYNAQYMQIDTR